MCLLRLSRMSVKRSWDVRRDTRSAPAPVVRKRESLKEKRKKNKKVFFIVLGVVCSLLIVAAVYGMWQAPVRISSVTAEGPEAEAVQKIAERSLEGTYGYVLPRNSIFIFPESSIRASVLRSYPNISAVSISRTSFTEIHVRTVLRASAFVWCGVTADAAGNCYDADAEGLIFGEIASLPTMAKSAPVEMDTVAASVMDVVPEQNIDPSSLRIYAQLESENNDDGTPLRAHVVGAERIPDALRFVKAMRALNVSIVSIEIRDDEADLYTPQGTRITYILGDEEKSAALAASSFPSLNLSDGQLAYVDLRFEGKVYIKRRGE